MHLTGLQDTNAGSVHTPVLEESHRFLTQACERLHSKSVPDVMLKLGDDKLRAHRSLLSESSPFFKGMFQARILLSQSILKANLMLCLWLGSSATLGGLCKACVQHGLYDEVMKEMSQPLCCCNIRFARACCQPK